MPDVGPNSICPLPFVGWRPTGARVELCSGSGAPAPEGFCSVCKTLVDSKAMELHAANRVAIMQAHTLVIPAENSPPVVLCAGARCAWFVQHSQTPEGQSIGVCAPAALAVVMSRLPVEAAQAFAEPGSGANAVRRIYDPSKGH